MTSFTTALREAYENSSREGPRRTTRQALRRAVRCLDLSEVPASVAEQTGIEAALMLEEVLDRIEVPPPEAIPGKDEVEDDSIDSWRIPHTSIKIAQVQTGQRAGEFLFTPDTVDRADLFYERVLHLPYKPDATPDIYRAYAATPGGRLRVGWVDRLPDWATRLVAGQAIWQWAAALLTVALLFFLVLKLLKVGARIDGQADPERPWERRRGATILAVAVSALAVAGADLIVDDVINFTGLNATVAIWAFLIIEVLLVSWLIALVLNELAEFVIRARKLPPRSPSSQLVRFVARFATLVVIVVILVVGAQAIGIPAYSVLAGFGVGGLALALGAQGMLQDLVASGVIMFDRPFRIDDLVVIGDQRGFVESIGFRSTRIRTLDDSVLTIPNSQAAALTIDNLGKRKYRRVVTTLGISDATPPERIETFLEGIKEIIRKHPTTWKDRVLVALHDFGSAGLDVRLDFYLDVPDREQEFQHRQEVLLKILRLAETQGVRFAPTIQVHASGLEGFVAAK